MYFLHGLDAELSSAGIDDDEDVLVHVRALAFVSNASTHGEPAPAQRWQIVVAEVVVVVE